jgi:Domain of Unknown Function with PDB structure (DUF3857)
MMRYTYLTLLLCSFFLGRTVAQTTKITFKIGREFYQSDSIYYATDTTSLFRWGKVPEADLKMTKYALDTSADAVVLFDIGFIQAESGLFNPFSSTFSRFRRVKILKKSAFSTVGDVKIRFQIWPDYSTLRQMDAQIIQPDGTIKKIKTTDVFVEQNARNYCTAKFAFPDLQEGSIIEYCYQIVTNDNPFTLTDWYFQEDLPVRHNELFLNVPSTYEYQFLCQGDKYPKMDRLDDSSHITLFRHALANGNTTRFAMDSIPAMKAESYVTTMDNYRSRIRFQLSRFMMPDGKLEDVLNSWEKLAETLTKHPLLGQQYLKKNNYKDVWRAVKKQLSDTMTVDEKIKTVYEYLTKNVTWIDDDFSAFAESELDAVFKKRRGNSGELNLMLIACLREAEIEALPMLISTRDNGRAVPSYPIVRQFNHLICYTEATGKPLLLDVGTVHRPMGLPRTGSLNGQGWILQGANSRWVEIMPPPSTQLLAASFVLSENGSLKGSLIRQHTGYSAVNELLTNQNDDKNEHLRKGLATDFTGIIIDSIKIKGAEDHKANLKQAVYCTIENAATVADDLMYLKPTLKTDFDQSPFRLAERNYPVEFPYPIRDEFVMVLTLPKTYEVEEMPQSFTAKLGEKGGKFEYTATKEDDTIKLNVKIEIRQLYFEAKDYGMVKDFFNKIVSKQAEQIVLKKKKA